MGMGFRIATAQMAVHHSASENLPRILETIDRARESAADFLLLPECVLSGYHGDFDQREIQHGLESIAEAAERANTVVLVGTSFRDGQSIYNQVRIYDEAGRYVGAHSKTVPTSGDLEWCVAGGGLQVFRARGLAFGALICNDLWCTPPSPRDDPHLVQRLKAMGAQVVFHSINSGFDQRYLKWHTAHLETYAWLHALPIVTSNVGGDEPNNCPTGVLNAEGEWVCQLDRQGEGLAVTALEV